MAAVLNFDAAQAPSRAVADASMATVVAHISSLPARVAVLRIASYQAQLEAAEARALATAIDSTGDTKMAERLAASGRTSSRSRKRAARRAAAVKKNTDLADKMAAGDLSGEHVDVLANAAAKTNGASLTDQTLIDSVANANPDLGKSIIDDYLRKRDGAAGEQTRHNRQRAQRRVARFRTKDDCEAILIAGDKATIDRIWNETTRVSNALYQSDGGRDVPNHEHARSHDQRMFDAITNQLLDDGDNDGGDGDADATAGRSISKRPVANKARPTIVIGVQLDKFSGDPDQAAELLGSGPVADSVLAAYLGADPDIVGAVFGTSGELLWLGRRVRLANRAQYLGLIVRDKHCVLCGAGHTRCRAHHIQPWSAPQGGLTDIDNLVLVCDSCHRYVHDNKQTMFRPHTSHHWKLRDALPHEIPPPRPPAPSSGQAPMRT